MFMVDFVAAMTAHLQSGSRIRMSGLGTLEVRQSAARTGRNPATGSHSDQGEQEGGIPAGEGAQGGHVKAGTNQLAFSYAHDTVQNLGVVGSPNETDAGSTRQSGPGRSNRGCMDRPAGAGREGEMKWRVMVELGGAGGALELREVSVGECRRALFGGNAWVDGGGGQENAGRVAAPSGPGADRGVLPEPTSLRALWRATPAQGHPSPTTDVVVWHRGGSRPSFWSLPMRRGVAPDHHPGRRDYARPLHAGV